MRSGREVQAGAEATGRYAGVHRGRFMEGSKSEWVGMGRETAAGHAMNTY